MKGIPQHVQKREIVDIQKFKYKHKSKNKTLSHSIKSKNAPVQGYLISCTELITNNSRIRQWGRDLLGVQFKYLLPKGHLVGPSPTCFYMGFGGRLRSVKSTGSRAQISARIAIAVAGLFLPGSIWRHLWWCTSAWQAFWRPLARLLTRRSSRSAPRSRWNTTNWLWTLRVGVCVTEERDQCVNVPVALSAFVLIQLQYVFAGLPHGSRGGGAGARKSEGLSDDTVPRTASVGQRTGTHCTWPESWPVWFVVRLEEIGHKPDWNRPTPYE